MSSQARWVVWGSAVAVVGTAAAILALMDTATLGEEYNQESRRAEAVASSPSVDDEGRIEDSRAAPRQSSSSPGDLIVEAPEVGLRHSSNFGAPAAKPEIDDLEAVLEAKYGALARVQLRAEFRALYAAIDVGIVNAIHSEKVEAGDFEVVDRVSIGADGMKTVPVMRHIRSSDAPFMVQIHERPNGDVIRTSISADDVPFEAEKLLELAWLKRKIQK